MYEELKTICVSEEHDCQKILQRVLGSSDMEKVVAEKCSRNEAQTLIQLTLLYFKVAT